MCRRYIRLRTHMRIYYLLCSLLYFCDGGSHVMFWYAIHVYDQEVLWKHRKRDIIFLSTTFIFFHPQQFFIWIRFFSPMRVTVNACYYYMKDIAGALTLEINQTFFRDQFFVKIYVYVRDSCWPT